MQPRVLTSELTLHVDQEVTIRGWINNIRPFGKLSFLILRDRSGFAQVVIENKEEAKRLAALQPGSVLSIRGRVSMSPQAELGVEMVSPTVTVEVPIHEPSPIEYYKPEIPNDLDFILDHRPMALRNRRLAAIFSIQAEVAHAYRQFMHDTVGAVEYFAPNIIGASSEGGAEFFNVDYFGYTATLAQSSQLYKQIMVGVHERVFALMPFFRAEPSHTPRHLAEGKQFEFEMGFFDDWREILDIQEACIKSIVKHLQTRSAEQLKVLGDPLVKVPLDVPFPRLTFAEAQELFYQRTGIDEREEPDLSPRAERELSAWALETKGTELVFITDWLTSKRPFYAYPNDENPKISNTFDLLCAGTEITSGGQRRHTFDSMVEGILSKGMDPANFEDYLSIFKYGMPPHGGFGMGLERLTMTLLRLSNIREASLFPSDPKRIAGNRIKAHIFFGKENIRGEILRQLKAGHIPFTHLVHEPAPSSQDAVNVRGTKPEEGVKAIIIRGKQSKKNYQFNLPGHARLDMKAVAALVGEKCEFEDPQVILERFGLEIGGIPPFGNLLNLDTFYEESIASNERAAFNCGLLTESIVMPTKELIELVKPKLARFLA